MINLKNNLLKMGRTIFHQRDSLGPVSGMSYSMGPGSDDPCPSPTLFFYWHEPVMAPKPEIPVRDARGPRSWFEKLGLARQSA